MSNTPRPKPLRIGLVGAGRHGSRYLDPQNAPVGGDGKVTEFNHRIDSFERLLGDVDAVIVATPPSVRAEYILPALAAGVPVLVEKPLALSSAQAFPLLAAARRSGTPLMLALQHLFAPGFVAACGDLQNTPGTCRVDVTWAGLEREDGSCSAIYDWGPHAYSLAGALRRARPEAAIRVRTGLAEERCTEVRVNDAVVYDGTYTSPTPMAVMMAEFCRVARGGAPDWRSGEEMAIHVQRQLLSSDPCYSIDVGANI